jgi:hypothetical protein
MAVEDSLPLLQYFTHSTTSGNLDCFKFLAILGSNCYRYSRICLYVEVFLVYMYLGVEP